jgi:hypothetical protein
MIKTRDPAKVRVSIRHDDNLDKEIYVPHFLGGMMAVDRLVFGRDFAGVKLLVVVEVQGVRMW